jgi:hypothetical protein
MARCLARREFITLVGGLAVTWPVAAWALQPDDQASTLLGGIQRLQAEYAADKIDQFIEGIKSQIVWTAQLLWRIETLAQRRFNALRLLREVPAVTEIRELDPAGHEQLKVSRFRMDVVGAGTDYSGDPQFTEAVAKRVYYSSVFFRREPRKTEPAEEWVWEQRPYMTLSVAGARRDAGVTVAEISLVPIQDSITKMKVGDRGVIYVLDNQGRVIAHSDVKLVQQDFSKLAHVQAAHTGTVTGPVQVVRDINGREVLATYSHVATVGWPVFVELPVEEVNAAAQ